MTHTVDQTLPAVQQKAIYGFISVVHVPDLGHCGGLLLLSELGRPVEFHCTAPVAENRAQKILYGETFESFLYCDQIGLALTDKAKFNPQIILTDSPLILPLNDLIQAPVVLVEQDDADDPSFEDQEFDRFHVGRQAFRAQGMGSQPLEHAKKLCANFAIKLPLDEPFERIRSAIEEAQSVAR